MSACGTPSSRQASLSAVSAASTYACGGVAIRTWSDWIWTPIRSYRSKSGNASRPIVNVPSAAVTSMWAMPTRGSIPAVCSMRERRAGRARARSPGGRAGRVVTLTISGDDRLAAGGAMTSTARPSTPHKNMTWIPGGTFLMGSADFYPEERPVHEVTVDGFWMDEHQVTVAEFRRFVKATGHVTVAERPLDPADYPDADPTLLVPGSLVFQRTRGPVPLDDYHNWWAWVPGASWRQPGGPGTTITNLDRHPVTHVAWEDVAAYAAWAGKELPTEAEWEFAARGGLDGKIYTWGDEFAPRGRMMANTWQGEFPWQNLTLDGYEGTSPVGH